MSQQELKSHIKQVHAELERAHELNYHERDLLGTLMEDIVVIASNSETVNKGEELSSELDRQANKFETSHPKLAGLMRQIMDTLAKLGI